MLVKPRRLLFQSSGYLLSLVVGFGLPYWLVRLITGSKMLATYVLAFSIVLVTPLLFIVLYWSYRLEFRPLPITPEESKNNSQSSMLLAISSLFLIWGVLIFQHGWVFLGAVGVTIYVFLTARLVRVTWRSQRGRYKRLVAQGRLSEPVPTAVLTQPKNLRPIIALIIASQVFLWGGLYIVSQGAVSLGISVTAIGVLLCLVLVRKVRQSALSQVSVT
jgi:hypothetical protein